MEDNETILDILTQKPPELNHTGEREGPNTKGPTWSLVRPQDVALWSDFTIENITAAYGDLLTLPVPDHAQRRVRADELSTSECEFVNEDAIDFFFQSWIGRVVKQSMKHCTALVRQRLGLPPAEPSLRPRPLGLKDEGDPKNLVGKPDWMIYVRPDEQIFVVGESKLSSKWRSQWLSTPRSHTRRPHVDQDKTHEEMWPIRQIATYCRMANTRYGFLFTPLELVAVRVYDMGLNRCGVDYQAIPYSNWGGQTLTIHLAIWTLAMMGANENVRNWVPKDQVVSLASWTRTSGSNRLIHCLSGREMDEQTVRGILGNNLIIHPDQGPRHPLLPPTSPRALTTRSTTPIRTLRKPRASSPLATSPVRNMGDKKNKAQIYSSDEDESGPSRERRRG